MIRFTIKSNEIDATELQAELAAAGFDVEVTVEPIDEEPFSYPPEGDSLTPEQYAQIRQIIKSHRTTETRQLDLLVTKARAVWNETDTFTAAQAQKILAGLVLLEARRR